MSTSTTDMARSAFSTAAFAQLVQRLRHTNARYNQIALQFRHRMRPTHHAKRRAYRAGLHIDTTKARACPTKYISTEPPPVLDRSQDGLGWPDAYATADNAIVGEHSVHPDQGDAYMRVAPLKKPEVIVRKNRRGGRQRVVLRLPPLKLYLDVDPCGASFQGPVPGAPKLLPRQLPDDECGAEDMPLYGSMLTCSSSTDESDLLTPFDLQVYSGLCITIPPRTLKRKLHDVETDEDTASPQQPKRYLKARWDDAHMQ